MNAEELFLQKYGNKITASESWVIRFAEEYLEQSRQADVIGTLPLSKVDGLLRALEDIKNWDDDLEDEWEDQGYRAIAALKEWSN